VTRKTGNRLWIISDEISISKLTKPRVQMAKGMWTGVAVRLVSCDGVLDFMDKAAVVAKRLILSFIGL